MSGRFARVTDLKGRVRWINLDHVRHITENPAMGKRPAHTSIHIGNYLIEQSFEVFDRPEDILAQD